MAPQDTSELDALPKEHRPNFTLDNKGNLVFKNRAYRRRKPPTDNWEAKNTHAIKKKRDNAKAKNNRRSS